MPDPAKHHEHRGALETLLRQIPGFRGYLEKEYRRDADALQRGWLADRLQRSKRTIDDLARRLTDAGRLDELGRVDRVRAALDKLIGRIRGAMRGYSGFFDLVQVDEAVLDRIYNHDVAVLEHVMAVTDAVEKLPGHFDKPGDALAEVIERIEAVGRQWDLREDVLKGVE